MPTWPVTLPQQFEQEGFIDSEPNLFIRSDMDAGPPKLRRRYTAGHRPFSGTMIMTIAQKAIFRTFYRTYGSVEFDFPDPDTGATVSVVFVGTPEYAAIAGDDWQVKLQMAVMP